jgi:type I restriction enzyme S subunit
MSWKKVKLKEVLKQYRVQHIVQDDTEYKQVTISKYDGVTYRGSKIGKDIGRKRQFVIDLKSYPNTLMLVRQGVQDGSIGIAPLEVDGCIATENMPMFSVEGINLEYLRFLLKSPYFYDELNKIETTGSAQKSIHERQILEIEIPLPNLQEQKEFVKDLTKLKNGGLVISSELSHQLDLIKQLRQSFLREAMQGKLVTAVRSSAVETQQTGQQLLAKIKAEKAQLIAEKKLKKEKPLPVISAEEIPFEIPKHWTWCRGNDLANYIDPQPSHRTPPESKDGVPYVAMSDIKKDGTIDFSSTRKVSFIVLQEHKNRYQLEEGDFIFGKIGTLGKPVLLPKPYEYTLSANVILIQANRKIVRHDYLFHFLGSPIAEKELLDKKSTTSYPVFGMAKARNMLIPLPPLHEQEQIVAKIEELMAFCDGLEQSIKESQGYNEMLLQQVLREALQGEEKVF